MQYWQIVFEYFIHRGFPETLLFHGCISSNDASQIIDVIRKKRPRTILEVGTFIGLSTGVIALASGGGSTLVCVDPNLPVGVQSKEFGYFESRGSLVFVRNMLEYFGEHQKTTILEGFFSCLPCRGFREQLISLGIDFERVGIVRDRVGEFAPYNLVFIDGDHHAESVCSDLSLVYRHLSEDGIILLHDVSGGWASEVNAGIRRFLQDHPEFSIKVEDNLGFLGKS